MSEQNYISRQITVYKTDKKLIEFIDKLKPAPTDFYAHIHSFGDKDEEGVKQTSCTVLFCRITARVPESRRSV